MRGRVEGFLPSSVQRSVPGHTGLKNTAATAEEAPDYAYDNGRVRVPVRNRKLRRERCRMPLTRTERPTKLIRRGGLTITDRLTRVPVVVSFVAGVVESRQRKGNGRLGLRLRLRLRQRSRAGTTRFSLWTNRRSRGRDRSEEHSRPGGLDGKLTTTIPASPRPSVPASVAEPEPAVFPYG